MRDTAIVILNWNGLTWLQRFLPDVVKAAEGAEVVVADNGSSDGSVNWLETSMPGVRTISLERNLGFAAGYNAVALAKNWGWIEIDRFEIYRGEKNVYHIVPELVDTASTVQAVSPRPLAFR